MIQENRFELAELHELWTARGHELLLHDPGGPGESLIRRGELLVRPDAADLAAQRLRRWVDGISEEESLARIRLRAAERDRCVDIARETAQRVPGVAPNHVHVGCGTMFGAPVSFGTPVAFGTGAVAEEAQPPGEPPDDQWSPRVVVGVLDTGCDPHPWFRERSWFEPVVEVLDADDDARQDRQAGHGTFVSGIVLRYAPGVVLRHRRVLSPLGITDDSTVAAGLSALRREAKRLREPVQVVLLTAGCHTPDDECPPVLRAELEQWAGSVVVASAGNHGTARPFWPAADPSVLAVTATEGEPVRSDGAGQPALAEFANAGGWVDAAAPGVAVVSSFVRLSSGGRRNYGYARWSGTSFAAPRAAAAAAWAMRHGANVAEAWLATRKHYPFEG